MELQHFYDLSQGYYKSDITKLEKELKTIKSFNVHALDLIPALADVINLSLADLNSIFGKEDTSRILVQNEILKATLIGWKPGKTSSIHGHPKGGCVFKVLHGNLKEVRYNLEEETLSKSIISKGGIGYIDDSIGLHAVSNAFDVPAISLHIYAYNGRMLNS